LSPKKSNPSSVVGRVRQTDADTTDESAQPNTKEEEGLGSSIPLKEGTNNDEDSEGDPEGDSGRDSERDPEGDSERDSEKDSEEGDSSTVGERNDSKKVDVHFSYPFKMIFVLGGIFTSA